MPEQGSAPTTLADEGGVYTKGVSNATQVFFRSESNGQEYQLSLVDDTRIASFATSAGTVDSGWTFLPGGMLLQYGLTGTLVSGGDTTITFPKPFTNPPYSVQTTMIRDSGNVDVAYVKSVATVTTTQFVIRNTSGGNRAYWMAIGV